MFGAIEVNELGYQVLPKERSGWVKQDVVNCTLYTFLLLHLNEGEGGLRDGTCHFESTCCVHSAVRVLGVCCLAQSSQPPCEADETQVPDRPVLGFHVSDSSCVTEACELLSAVLSTLRSGDNSTHLTEEFQRLNACQEHSTLLAQGWWLGIGRGVGRVPGGGSARKLGKDSFCLVASNGVSCWLNEDEQFGRLWGVLESVRRPWSGSQLARGCLAQVIGPQFPHLRNDVTGLGDL